MLQAGGAPLNIANGLREQARAQGHAVAVVDEGKHYTYSAIAERAARLANGLGRAGLGPGSRVALLLGNRAEYLEAAAGIAMAGMTMVPMNPRSSPAEIRFMLEHSGARALVVESALSGGLPTDPTVEVRLSIDGTEAGPSYEAFLERSRPVDPAVTTAETDTFCIAYTSGTTGRPKGVLLSHRSRSLTFLASALEWGLGPGRRSIAVAPLYHGAGFAFGYASVFAGGRIEILRRWDPEQMLHMVEKGRAQSVFLVPTHAQVLRSFGIPARGADMSSLDTMFFNASALPRPLKEWVMDSFPGVGVHELYGSTEASVVTDLRPPDAARKAGSVGQPWFMTEVKLIGPDGRPVPEGVPGELFSRSPFLMSGYLDDPAATQSCTTDDGFLSSGDLAVADAEGFLSIVGRTREMIITGGVNVYPREVEDLIAAVPGVAEVAVKGAPDTKWGEVVVAYVVFEPGSTTTITDIDVRLAAELASFKRPRRWQVMDRLPRNPAGKIVKGELIPPRPEE